MASEGGDVVSGDEGVTSVVGGVVSVGDGVVVSSGVASEGGDVVSGDEGVTSAVGGVVSVGAGGIDGVVQAPSTITLTARSESNLLITVSITD